MIYSLTPFFNELDVLEIRLAELDPVVDRFIIGEATVTHSGQPKELLLEQHWDRFERWHRKIVYVAIRDMPEGEELRDREIFAEQIDSDHWLREKHQRRALTRGLLTGLDEEDMLILSDLDEIPSRQVIEDCANHVRKAPIELLVPRLAMHVYRLRWRWRHTTIPICRMFSPELLWEHDGDLEAVRLLRDPLFLGGRFDEEALGWHLAYMGDIPTKLAAMAHRELDTPAAHAAAEDARSSGWDLWGRQNVAYECPDRLMPPYVSANADRFADIL